MNIETFEQVVKVVEPARIVITLESEEDARFLYDTIVAGWLHYNRVEQVFEKSEMFDEAEKARQQKRAIYNDFQTPLGHAVAKLR